jgi:hypothetical protein
MEVTIKIRGYNEKGVYYYDSTMIPFHNNSLIKITDEYDSNKFFILNKADILKALKIYETLEATDGK